MELRNQPVQGADVVMETEGHIVSCAIASATRTLRSQSPSACQYVHRTGPGRPSCCPSGPGEEGRGRTLTMHDTRESDNGIVPQKPSNQKQLCFTEGVEGRPLTKGNMFQSPAARTQSRGPASRGRSYWIPGSYVTSNSMSAGSNALPRLRTLCTNSKNPR